MAFFVYYRGGVSSAIVIESLEYSLANYVGKNDSFVARFRSLMKQLSAEYVKNRQQIADMMVKAQRMLRDERVRERMLNIMEA